MKKFKLYFAFTLVLFTTICMSQNGKEAKRDKITGLPKVDASANFKTILTTDSISSKKLPNAQCDNKSLKDSLDHLKKTLRDVNSLFLKDLFVNAYIVDSSFLVNTDLLDVDTGIIKKSNVLCYSLLTIGNMGDTVRTIKRVLAFNINYFELSRIQSGVLSQKYDSLKVSQAISILDSLPQLNSNWKLSNTKINLRNLLINYNVYSCDLKKRLDYLKEGDQKSNLIKSAYKLLQNEIKYKYSPYLVSIVKNISADKTTYNDNLLDCPKPKEK